MGKFPSDRSRAQWFAESFPERKASVLQFRAWIAECGTDGKKVKDGLATAVAVPKNIAAEEAAADSARIRESLRVLFMAAERLAHLGDARYARANAAATRGQKAALGEIEAMKKRRMSVDQQAMELDAKTQAALPHARVQSAARAVLLSVGAKRRALWAARVRRKRDAVRKAVDVRTKAEAEARRAARAAKKEAGKAPQMEVARARRRSRSPSKTGEVDAHDGMSRRSSHAESVLNVGLGTSPEEIGAAAAEAYVAATLSAVAEQV